MRWDFFAADNSPPEAELPHEAMKHMADHTTSRRMASSMLKSTSFRPRALVGRVPVQDPPRLPRAHAEVGVPEGERSLGRRAAERLGVVVHDVQALGVHANGLRRQLRNAVHGVHPAGGAVEDLAVRRRASFRHGRKHRGDVPRVRQRRDLLTRPRDGKRASADDAVEEPIQVVALVRLRAVDVLRSEGRPRQADLRGVLLHAPLPRALGGLLLHDGILVSGRVHSRRGHEDVVLYIPAPGQLGHMATAVHILGIVVVHDVEPRASEHGVDRRRVRRIDPVHGDPATKMCNVGVTPEGLLVHGAAIVENDNLHALLLREHLGQMVS
eukprot:scaffold7351_cov259-Pinguiococcus_pyrenoidosus.AAC.26